MRNSKADLGLDHSDGIDKQAFLFKSPLFKGHLNGRSNQVAGNITPIGR